MTYLIKISTRPVKYGTAETLRARFTATHRKVEDLGFAHVVEQVGVDRSSVDVDLPKDARRADGRLGISPSYNRFRLLDRNQHVRVLAEDDAMRLRIMDAEIASVEAALAGLRSQRAQIVAKAWRRGTKVNLSDLEDQAKAAEAKRLEATR